MSELRWLAICILAALVVIELIVRAVFLFAAILSFIGAVCLLVEEADIGRILQPSLLELVKAAVDDRS